MKLILALLILAAVAPAQTFVNACAKDNGGFSGTNFNMNSCTGTGSSNHTAGNLLFLAASFENKCSVAGTITIANVAGDTWTLMDTVDSDPLGNTICLKTYYVKSAIGNSADNIQITTQNSVFLFELSVIQFSGTNSTAPLDVSGVAGKYGASGTVLVSNAFSTTAVNEVVISAFSSGYGHTYTADSNYTLNANTLSGLPAIGIQYRIVTSILSSSTVQVSETTPNNFMTITANSFKSATQPVATTKRRILW